ncbi:unnamed protein product, partial [Effrenium voratum]
MSACEKTNQWERAADALSQLPVAALQPSLVACNAALSACRWRVAARMLATLRRLLRPDLVSWNAFASACEKQSVWRSVLGVFQQLSLQRLAPDERTFAAAFFSSTWPRALRLARQMAAASLQLDVIMHQTLLESSLCVRQPPKDTFQQLSELGVSLLRGIKH